MQIWRRHESGGWDCSKTVQPLFCLLWRYTHKYERRCVQKKKKVNKDKGPLCVFLWFVQQLTITDYTFQTKLAHRAAPYWNKMTFQFFLTQRYTVYCDMKRKQKLSPNDLNSTLFCCTVAILWSNKPALMVELFELSSNAVLFNYFTPPTFF